MSTDDAPSSATSPSTKRMRQPCGAEGCKCHLVPDEYQIDYERSNKKVRQYSIADVSTVRLAIGEHITEFLKYHKVPQYNGYEYARWVFGILIIIAGGFSYLYKFENFMDNRPIYFTSAFVFVVCSAAQLYISKFVEGSTTFFITKPYANKDLNAVKALLARVPTPEEQDEENAAHDAKKAEEEAKKKSKGRKKAEVPVPEEKKEEGAENSTEKEGETTEEAAKREKPARVAEPALPQDYATYVTPIASSFTKDLQTFMTDRQIRFRLEMNESLPSLTLYADLLNRSSKNGFWSSPSVIATVEAHHAYGDFFDSEGFVHPPMIKSATMDLVRALHEKVADSKKKR